MRDWKKFVSKRMASLPMPHDAKEDVIAELALHLEETYEHALATGLSAEAACALTRQEVEDWRVLADNICYAKQEIAMNHRTRTLWLPGITILFAAGLVLMFLGRAALLQRVIWIACMALLLAAAASEANRLSQRTRRFWLPGFINMTAAGLFLFASDVVYDPFRFFREVSLHPQTILSMNSGSLHSFYFVWLSAQVAFGALGALFSRRAGGTCTERIVAGAFPAVVIVGTYVALMPVTSMFSGRAATSPFPAYLASAMLVWVAAPAFALLLGAAPFLRESQLQEA